MTELLRVYAPDECEPGTKARHSLIPRPGYPKAWSKCPDCHGAGEIYSPPNALMHPPRPARDLPCLTCHGAGSIKALVRQLAGHRCVRCLHPFRVGVSGLWEKSTTLEAVNDPRLFAEAELAEQLGPPMDDPRATLWSDCDALCRHVGPMRAQTTEGWHPFEPKSADVTGPAVMAIAPAKMQAAWRILTVHHLNELKNDCRWWNLAALCQRCHLEIQGKVNMAQIWPHEHTEWFRVYAAGYYAAVYEKRDITREEAEERMEELLGYERLT